MGRSRQRTRKQSQAIICWGSDNAWPCFPRGLLCPRLRRRISRRRMRATEAGSRQCSLLALAVVALHDAQLRNFPNLAYKHAEAEPIPSIWHTVERHSSLDPGCNLRCEWGRPALSFSGTRMARMAKPILIPSVRVTRPSFVQHNNSPRACIHSLEYTVCT